MPSRAGFTLIELVVTATICGVILLAVGLLFGNTSKVYRTNETVAERQQRSDIVAKLLRYELSLANYRGTDPTQLSSNAFSGDQLIVTQYSAATTSDIVQVRYYEDRFLPSATSFELRDVTYRIADDGGTPNLFRKESGDAGNGFPAVEEVSNLKVTEYLLEDGTTVTPPAEPTITDDNPLVAVTLQVTYTDGTSSSFATTFQNAPDVTVSTDP